MNILPYTPPPTISRFLQSRAFIRSIMGPFGSGKSVGSVMALVKNAMEQQPDAKGMRRSRYAIIRNTYRQLDDTTKKTIFDWLPDGVAGTYKSGKNMFVLRFGDVESEWLFRALDSPDDVRNLLSMELTGAWINEYREIPSEVLINLIGRLRYPESSRIRLPGIVMDTNPPPLGSFWHRLATEPPPAEIQAALDVALKDSPDGPRPLIEHFQQPGGKDENAENLEHLPPGYYDLMIAANADKGEDWLNVHVHGNYGPDPSNLPVYPQYRANLHAPKPFPYRYNHGLTTYVGLDFGRTPAAVLAQQLKNDRWVVFSELTTVNCTTEEFIPKLAAWLARWDIKPSEVKCYGDPAGSYGSEQNRLTSFQMLRREGFVIIKGERSPEKRLGAVRKLLATIIDGRPGLMIDAEEAPMLAEGFAGAYCFKRNQEGEMNPDPRKNKYSHPHDALQHLLGRIALSAGGQQDAIKAPTPWSLYGKTA
ncbi:MAG: hypothetical protein EA406_02235 [Rhodospirillales bacterium]|nr:MAG: hypothetical protein EA406_02235 [Rhodospirillales bacterium]